MANDKAQEISFADGISADKRRAAASVELEIRGEKKQYLMTLKSNPDDKTYTITFQSIKDDVRGKTYIFSLNHDGSAVSYAHGNDHREDLAPLNGNLQALSAKISEIFTITHNGQAELGNIPKNKALVETLITQLATLTTELPQMASISPPQFERVVITGKALPPESAAKTAPAAAPPAEPQPPAPAAAPEPKKAGFTNKDFVAAVHAIAKKEKITLPNGKEFDGTESYAPVDIRGLFEHISEPLDLRSCAIIAHVNKQGSAISGAANIKLEVLSNESKPLKPEDIAAGKKVKDMQDAANQYKNCGGEPLDKLGNAPAISAGKQTGQCGLRGH